MQAKKDAQGIVQLRAEVPADLYRELRLILVARDETIKNWVTTQMRKEIRDAATTRRI